MLTLIFGIRASEPPRAWRTTEKAGPDRVKVIGIRPMAPVQNSVSLKLLQRKTLNFVTNLPDVRNITK